MYRLNEIKTLMHLAFDLHILSFVVNIIAQHSFFLLCKKRVSTSCYHINFIILLRLREKKGVKGLANKMTNDTIPKSFRCLEEWCVNDETTTNICS